MNDPDDARNDREYRVYEDEELFVFWKPNLCIRSGNCVRGSKEVFDPKRRPWIMLGLASCDRITAVIETCPSGALSYERKSDMDRHDAGRRREEPK